MPTYDYVCAACGHAFERFQEMSAKKLRRCPACGKNALERQVGAGAGLIFKGSGFYITDYKKTEAPAADAKPAAAEAKPAAAEARKDAPAPAAAPAAKSGGGKGAGKAKA